MRELTDHKANPVNDQLTANAVDGPGPGGASHHYEITGPNISTVVLKFQNGAIAENGVNGITQEVLLSVLIDRLEGFQSGPFANDYNARALQHLREAQAALLDRTKERMSRGVEGTLQI